MTIQATPLNPTKPLLAVFDFDGTLTYRDSFVPFLRFAFGKYRFSLRLAGRGAHFMFGGMTRDAMKAQLIKTFLKGVPVAWFEERAQAYCEQRWAKLMRPAGLICVQQQLTDQAVVTICSASPALMVKPFADRLGVELIATELEVVDGVLTGNILGRNCRRDEKVLRLEKSHGDLNRFYMRAWGNSEGDTELLAAAQESFYRPFTQ